MNSTIVTTTYRDILGQLPPLPILTDHLIIRALRLSDSSDPVKFHSFFARYQTLAHTSRAIAYLTNTKHGSLCLGIFLKNSDQSEGDMIGIGGVRDAVTQGTWPIFNWEIMHPAYRGKGSLGTEFATAFMDFWWRVPVEAEQFRLQVPANTVGYPQQNETIVTARVIAMAHIKDLVKQHALVEAGFKKYFVAMGEDGMETYWQQTDPRTVPQPKQPPIPAQLHLDTSELVSGKSLRRAATTHPMITKSTELQSSSVNKEGAKTCQQQVQPSETRPSNTELTQAIWHMLTGEIEKDKLDVFQLQTNYVEGYVLSLSKKFGAPLENRRGEIWTAFKVCLDVQRGNKAAHFSQTRQADEIKAQTKQKRRSNKQAKQPSKSQSRPSMSQRAAPVVQQTSDHVRLPPLRLPPGRL